MSFSGSEPCWDCKIQEPKEEEPKIRGCRHRSLSFGLSTQGRVEFKIAVESRRPDAKKAMKGADTTVVICDECLVKEMDTRILRDVRPAPRHVLDRIPVPDDHQICPALK